MAKIKFIVDSAADVPSALAKELDIQVLPFPIIMGDTEIYDGIEYDKDTFYKVLEEAAEIPSHAQLNPIIFEEAYEEAYKAGYDAVIYACINFKGSATGNNAVMASDSFFETYPDAKGKFDIIVLDSKSYTYAIGYPVVEAARKASDGSMSAQEAAAEIQDWYDHNEILFAVYDLKFARKSGRVPVAAAIIGGAMGIRPIMSFPNGESKVLAKPRGDKNVIKTMMKMMTEDMVPGSPYIVINGSLADHNEEISKACVETLGYEPAETVKIGGVIAINAGPTVVGVICRTK